ncbi:inner membrane-spanning protein YciB [Azospirillum halopraeferens]|uniref:inner membrane-spanning protein YciB n=1 Tax=Azospirillum halopraeferens TaxID=34010 RepID=UPI0006888CFD|nr:septation protein IspZ [Azospirillum halopraeferens]
MALPIPTAARPLGPVLERLLIEMGPLVVFFVVSRWLGILPATAALMAATAVAVLYSLSRARRVPVIPLVSLAFTLVFGGITLVWNDATFIKIRPTVYNLAAGLALLVGLAMRRLLLKSVFDTGIGVDDRAWKTLTWRVAGFFLVLAALNEILWRTLPTDDWVAFKAFGMPVLNILFLAANWPFVRRRLRRPAPDRPAAAPQRAAATLEATGR